MRFVYPEEGRFTCLQCGDCCRSWEIALSEEEVRRIGSLDWAAAGLSPVAEPTVRVSDNGVSFSVLARRPDGACVFLTEDDACALHRHFGEAAKPLMCRMYPFTFHRVGESVAVDLAFSCRSVGEQRGDLGALHTEELAF